MKKISSLLVAIFSLGVLLFPTPTVQAAVCTKGEAGYSPNSPACQIKGGSDATTDQQTPATLQSQIKNIVNVLLFILGAIAVIMIVVGGIRYTTSNGDSSAITSAKNTILYAVIGLVVAMLAYAIVNFIIDAF
jgi:magnesium-transporting ATPase (P-type)